ncbi:carbohydrate ABC transporter permease [Lacrimispora indolis]|jgi:multiple sugar transport system permease protein|uniref:carbohydrate ABC transporter permease n=1 Tax=Lacrimispora indolis TaxID=69825 RepID=UPI000418BB16|nr:MULTISPECIES: sugar ABC transporter permease [Lachnospiraceae]MBE7718345.1 sugar ABC transporter permease [Lacrimispora celerecrescens]MDR2023138.1 sugar ABC transporter permease [Hungatella sp.]
MVKKRTIWPYVLVAPAVIIILCVVFIPVMNAILMSFQNYDLRRPKEIAFHGLTNYVSAFKDPLFWGALVRTILWVVCGVGFQFLFGFILALLLNQEFFGRGMVRAVSMIPWVTPGVLIGLMWRWIYDGNFGVLNDLLLKLHVISDKIPFLSQVPTAFPSVIVTIIWQGIPFFALMLLAALQGVSSEIYEASSIDGAAAWQKLFYITIPSIKNTIFVTALLRVIWVANSVDVIFNMTEGGPAYSTQTLSVYIFSKGNALNLGYASAMALLLAVLLLFAAIPYLKMNFKGEE